MNLVSLMKNFKNKMYKILMILNKKYNQKMIWNKIFNIKKTIYKINNNKIINSAIQTINLKNIKKDNSKNKLNSRQKIILIWKMNLQNSIKEIYNNNKTKFSNNLKHKKLNYKNKIINLMKNFLKINKKPLK